MILLSNTTSHVSNDGLFSLSINALDVFFTTFQFSLRFDAEASRGGVLGTLEVLDLQNQPFLVSFRFGNHRHRATYLKCR